MALKNNKSLGQHWLKDADVLADIADAAGIESDDVVLEIGPGLGTLTSRLLSRGKKVVAVEFDSELAKKLPGQFPGKNLEVVNQDILKFDLTALDKDYKVVANVPYYITSKIVQYLSESANPPKTMVILVQKEVAERLAGVGGGSVLTIATQSYYDVELGSVVPAQMFTPPPKVDSQVVVMQRLAKDKLASVDKRLFFQVLKAGFSAKRKKLKSSLSGGLQLDKDTTEELLLSADISPDSRAEDLEIDQWLTLTAQYGIIKG